MPLFNVTMRAVYMEYYDGVEADTAEEAQKMVETGQGGFDTDFSCIEFVHEDTEEVTADLPHIEDIMQGLNMTSDEMRNA